MHDELKLAEQLKLHGCEVGRSKSGRLLRVDCRQCPALPDEEILSQVFDCVALRELHIPGSGEIPGAQAEQLARLEKLKVLDVEGSEFDDACVEQLAEHSSLQVLNVRNTRVTSECVARLRKVMIGTRIIF